MILTKKQSAAARGLLGRLSYDDVAKSSGINKFTIMRFESGKNEPQVKTLESLRNFYESQGVEFLEYEGLRFRPDGTVRELNGAVGFNEFLHDVYSILKNGGDACVTNVDERLFEQWQGDFAEEHLKRMGEIKDLSFRILIEEGDVCFTAAHYAEYKYVTTKYFAQTPTYVYGDRKTEIIFKGNDVTVVIIQNQQIADAQRKIFQMLWDSALSVDVST